MFRQKVLNQRCVCFIRKAGEQTSYERYGNRTENTISTANKAEASTKEKLKCARKRRKRQKSMQHTCNKKDTTTEDETSLPTVFNNKLWFRQAMSHVGYTLLYQKNQRTNRIWTVRNKPETSCKSNIARMSTDCFMSFVEGLAVVWRWISDRVTTTEDETSLPAVWTKTASWGKRCRTSVIRCYTRKNREATAYERCETNLKDHLKIL